ncbi:MAG: phosphoenolpyruvate--protein phosphotransferase [Deltaproteobacteria bacterium]|nr:phosphoenolpyruvate--protein phosphotransferase [Deltaproteobacteria bacterium]
MSVTPPKTLVKKPFRLKGISVSSGIVRGIAYVIEKENLNIPHYWISSKEVPSEISRFKTALEKTRIELTQIKDRLCKYEGNTQIHILDSYKMILQDELLFKNTLDTIKNQRINAEWSLQKVLDTFKQAFLNVDEEYFRERNNDVDYVGERLLKNLMGKNDDSLQHIPMHSIIIAHDLSPADTSQLMKFKVKGFLTEIGGKTSHTAIIARAMEIPTLVACTKATKKIQTGDSIIIDGNEGYALLHPTTDQIKKYDHAKKQDAQIEKILLKEIHLPTETQDNIKIRLAANMELIEEMESIKTHGAEGVGLYRTEFLFLNRNDIPSEEEHFLTYQKVLKSIYPYYATLRTLDIGADKIPTRHLYEAETNPALGLRAIRFCLKETEIFKTQLRALLRASIFGKLKIMIPMISSVKEVQRVKDLLEEVKKELDQRKIQYDPHVKIGIMIEVPSAIMIAQELAREVDFFSIGTNDLIQYTLAIDRTNENVSYLYNPLHPAILRMLKKVVDAAHQERIEVSLCGEMASDPLYILVLLGLGFSELSMNALSIPRVKRIIRSVFFKDTKALVDQLLTISEEGLIESFVKKEMKKLIPSSVLNVSKA